MARLRLKSKRELDEDAIDDGDDQPIDFRVTHELDDGPLADEDGEYGCEHDRAIERRARPRPQRAGEILGKRASEPHRKREPELERFTHELRCHALA